VGEGNRDDPGQADTVADHGGGTGADEYEGEGADQFGEGAWMREGVTLLISKDGLASICRRPVTCEER
jgi:hypothetical protein